MSSSQGSGCCISSGDIWDCCNDQAQNAGVVQVAVMAPLGAAGGVARSATRVMLEVPGGTHVPVSVLGAQGWLCLLLGSVSSLGSELGPGRVLVLQQLFFILRQSILLMKQPVSHSQLCLAL